MKTFTIEEIKNYIQSQDSLGDVLYNLKEENIIKSNKLKEDKINTLHNCDLYCSEECNCITECCNYKNNKCSNCNHSDAQELHTCPYQSDINGDDEILCNCCDNCEQNFCEDI